MSPYRFDYDKCQLIYSPNPVDVGKLSSCIATKPIREVTPSVVKGFFDDCHHIIFEVTERCNLECEYCAYGKNYVQPKTRPLNRREAMSWTTAKTILDYYIDIWNNKGDNTLPISINFYGGEPLTNFNLISKITDYILNNKPEELQVIFHVTTNAIFLKRYINWLMDHDFHISVSVDGDERSNEYRKDKNGCGSFKAVINTLDYIRDNYPIYFKSRFMFQSVLNSNSTIETIESFFKRRFGKKTEFIPISRNHLAVKNSIDRISGNWRKLNDNDATLNHTNIIKRFTDYFFDDYLDFFNPKFIVAPGTCTPFSSRVFFSASGFIYACEKVDLNNPLGQIEGNKLCIDFDQIALRYSKMFTCYSEYCNSCLFLKACKHCLACEEGGIDYNGPCKEYKRIDKELINEVISFIRNNPCNI